MANFDNQYFFVVKADDERLPSLTPDVNTEDRRHTYEAQAAGSPPLVFFNGARDYQKKMGVPNWTGEMPDVLFDGSNLVVRSRIREQLLPYDIPHLSMHPAVYVDDAGKWREDYWYLTFTDRFDCWDRASSDYETEPLEMGGFKLHNVYSYSLDRQVLDTKPPEERLLFKMGGTLEGLVVCHESLAFLFRSGDRRGAELVPIGDY